MKTFIFVKPFCFSTWYQSSGSLSGGPSSFLVFPVRSIVHVNSTRVASSYLCPSGHLLVTRAASSGSHGHGEQTPTGLVVIGASMCRRRKPRAAATRLSETLFLPANVRRLFWSLIWSFVAPGEACLGFFELLVVFNGWGKKRKKKKKKVLVDLVVQDFSYFNFFGFWFVPLVGCSLILGIFGCPSCDMEFVILMLFPLVVWSFVIWSSVWTSCFGVVILFRWIPVVIAFGFCVGMSSCLLPVWHVLVALCWAFLDFRFQLWFCIKFTDLLLMGSVEFCLFLGLSL